MLNCEDDKALQAFEKYRVAQGKVPGMPGLHARPAFIAGWREALLLVLAEDAGMTAMVTRYARAYRDAYEKLSDALNAEEEKALTAVTNESTDPNFERGREGFKKGLGISDSWGDTLKTHHASLDAWIAGWLFERDLARAHKQVLNAQQTIDHDYQTRKA